MGFSKPPAAVAGTWPLGRDLLVNRLGYGAMRLCGQPGNFGPYADWEGGKRLLRRAVELGVNFIDTAHPYGPGWNEELIADALAPYPPGVVVATKGGVEKTAPDRIFPDGSAASLRRFCEGSLRRLKLKRIDLYQLHRPDPNEREDDPLVEYCTAHGNAYLPWGPLAAKPFAPHAPLTEASGLLGQTAQELGATTGQVALAWLLRRSPKFIVIPGTTTFAHLEENMAAATLTLTEAQFSALSQAP